MNKQEKIALSRYADYQRSNATELFDVYGRYSVYKAHAWDYCQDMMHRHDGWGLRIISHNTNIFTAGFLFNDPETGALKFMYITKNYATVVEVQ